MVQSLASIISNSNNKDYGSGPQGPSGFNIDPQFLQNEFDESKEIKSDEDNGGNENKLSENDNNDRVTDTGTDKDDKPGSDVFNAKDFAELIVSTENFIQEKVLSYFHHKTLYDDYERDRIDELLYNRKIKPEAMTKYDNLLLARLKEHQEYVKGLPFSDDEYSKLKKRWVAVLKDKNIDLSPGWALLMQTAVIMVPRALPVIANLSDRKERAQRYAAERTVQAAGTEKEQKQLQLTALQEQAEKLKKELETADKNEA